MCAWKYTCVTYVDIIYVCLEVYMCHLCGYNLCVHGSIHVQATYVDIIYLCLEVYMCHLCGYNLCVPGSIHVPLMWI